MSRNVPEWVYPGTRVWRQGESSTPWVIVSVYLGDQGRTYAKIEKEVSGEIAHVSVDRLMRDFTALDESGTMVVPLPPQTEVMVIPCDWSGPAVRWEIRGVVAEPGVGLRMILHNPRDSYAATPPIENTPLDEALRTLAGNDDDLIEVLG